MTFLINVVIPLTTLLLIPFEPLYTNLWITVFQFQVRLLQYQSTIAKINKLSLYGPNLIYFPHCRQCLHQFFRWRPNWNSFIHYVPNCFALFWTSFTSCYYVFELFCPTFDHNRYLRQPYCYVDSCILGENWQYWRFCHYLPPCCGNISNCFKVWYVDNQPEYMP